MEHVRVVPVRAYFVDLERGIEHGRRVIGFRAESEDWRGPTRALRQQAVEDVRERQALLPRTHYTGPDAA